MGRKRTRLYPMQLPIEMVEHDAATMPEEEWQATYAPIFGTRERAIEAVRISQRNRRPFIVLALPWAIYKRAMVLVEREARGGQE